MVRFGLLLVVVLGVVAKGRGAPRADVGDWWCSVDPYWDWSSQTKIPVWIHPDMASHMMHEDGTVWTDPELQAEVEFVLERIMDQAPSAMPPLYFAGFEDDNIAWDAPAGNGAGMWNVSIRPLLDPTQYCRSNEFGNANHSFGVHVRISSSIHCTDRRWEHWYYATPNDPRKTFGGLLIHELTHGLGFEHSDTCQANNPFCTDNPGEPQICSLMQAHGLESEYFEEEYSDWEALVDHYGGWENDGRYRRESADALTWTTLASGTFGSGPTSASNWSKGSTLMPIVTTDAATLNPHLWRWERSISTFTDWGMPYTGAQLGQVGTSQKSGYVYAFFMRGQSKYVTIKQPRYSYHTSTTSYTVKSSTYYAGRHGVSGAHDPKTDQIVHVWRDEDNTILLSLSTPTGLPGVPSSPVALANQKAATTPSVSCGESTVAYNCILVWARAAHAAGQRFHSLQWTQFTVSGSTLVFSNVYTGSHTMFGAPSVVYKGPSTSTSAFVVAFKNPGNCYYTLRKGTDPTSVFSSERSHCSGTGKHNGSPMLGSTVGNWAEAWAHFNTED